jgi:threonine/homoserine/homoserine lactone efflux protein
MVGILVLFGVIYILFLAFSSPKKSTTVRKIDTETGREIIEIHEVNEKSAAQGAAGCIVGGFGIIIGLFILIVIMGSIDGAFK